MRNPQMQREISHGGLKPGAFPWSRHTKRVWVARRQVTTCLASNRATRRATHRPLARGCEALEATLGYAEMPMPRAIHKRKGRREC